MDTADTIKVFISNRDSTCDECGEELGRKAWITLEREKGALCLTCADLDHLVFLPTGDAALTRRARKHSALSAVVLKFSRARRRYERQGLLVEEQALQQAETECLADNEIRARRAERERIRREDFDQQYIQAFAHRIRELFPHCPAGRDQQITEHACRAGLLVVQRPRPSLSRRQKLRRTSHPPRRPRPHPPPRNRLRRAAGRRF